MTVEEAAARGPFGVGLRTLEMVDETRPTEANREFAGSPTREMQVDIWYPVAPGAADDGEGPVDASGGPYPLIVFAHGYSSFRFQSASYLRHLASHGYVVAAPGFPQTRADSPGGPRMYAVLDQPGDVGFVIDELFAMDGDEASFLFEAIDEERVGLTGHSGGGLTSMITAYGPLRDERVDAVVPISPVGCLLPPDIAEGVSVPAMIVGGSIDGLVGPVSIRDAYEAASAPKYFVNIIGAEHIRFGDFDLADSEVGDVLGRTSRGDITGDLIRFAQGIGGDATACLEREDGTDALIEGEQQRTLLRTVALPFFDAYLKNDQGALRFLDETLPTLDGIRFESELIDVEQGGD
jgi:predicted dienelactone hydrolase